MSLTVSELRAEYHHGDVLGIGESRPRLSWITLTDIPGWSQASYEVDVNGRAFGRRDSDQSLFVEWPGRMLESRSRVGVRVRVWGRDGSSSEWSSPITIEAGLLSPDDWQANWVTPKIKGPDGRPAYLRHLFGLRGGDSVTRARLYATSAGINQLHLNGSVVGSSVLAPGWTAYANRLRYETHDVTDLVLPGANVLGVVVADGWWRGNLTWEMKRDVYGDRLGAFAQLEVTYADGTVDTIITDDAWRTSDGPILGADLYNGEAYDARIDLGGWATSAFDASDWLETEVFSPAVGDLVAPVGPPVRRIMELDVAEVISTPSNRTVLDFGQNLVGWVRFQVSGLSGTKITLHHAEVLENGELSLRPLRNAKATDEYILRGGEPESWEPTATFHGFRYVQVDGWPGKLDPAQFKAVVIHSDFPSTGTFSCSDPLLNRLNENAVWGLRGNFVDIPTDCPQRDERLGWTGDLQVFAPTASFLFDVSGFVSNWLEDLRAEQFPDGRVALVVPAGPPGMFPLGTFAAAAWGDAATVVPWTMHERFGDLGVLERQFDSMRAWVDFVREKAGERLLWPQEPQLGDWLDPDAPPDDPGRGKTDPMLVATAYFARSAQLVSRAADALGRMNEADEYGRLAAAVGQAFRDEFMTPSGLLSSDSVTAYALAIVFDLYDEPSLRARGVERISLLSAARGYRVSTGFVGTPLVLPALSAGGDTATAYRLLTETKCPSWLYPVTMGATTIWERWDSMLPDGSVNSGEMTSFNHYALGAVADWMHQVIGGISAETPGYRQIRFQPTPGGGVTSADCSLHTPYGFVSCRWTLIDRQMTLEVEVPPNTSGVVVRPALAEPDLEVTAGRHRWSYEVPENTIAL
jgi:alpha-L-rhamnosidase